MEIEDAGRLLASTLGAYGKAFAKYYETLIGSGIPEGLAHAMVLECHRLYFVEICGGPALARIAPFQSKKEAV